MTTKAKKTYAYHGLGFVYRDQITGFTGIATGLTTYISGCNQVLLQPPVKKNGEMNEAMWFDQQRLVTDSAPGSKPAMTLDNSETPGFDKAAPKR